MTNLRVVDGIGTGNYFPVYKDSVDLNEDAPLRVDGDGSLVTSGTVLTDFGTTYDPFAGSTISDKWTTFIGSGGSISVADSICTITAGTTGSVQTGFYKVIDYSPLDVRLTLTISQRIANQDIYIGFTNTGTPPYTVTSGARFRFTGTDNTKIRCISQSSGDTGGTDGDTTDIRLPNGYTTAQRLIYRIVYDSSEIRYYVGATFDSLVLIATKAIQRPDPYATMQVEVNVLNGTTPATSTTLSIDTISIKNFTTVDVRGEVTGDVTVQQKITPSTVNSSVVPLNSGLTFTGATESTLSVAGIQVSLKTDSNCLIYIDQSPDGTNWDMTDSYNYYASINNFGVTIQAIYSYYRVRVTNTSTINQTYLRLKSVLCPIVEALPRSLDAAGHLKVGIKSVEDRYGYDSENTSMGEVRVVEPVRLVGAVFEGTTVDANFWITAATGTAATIAQANSQLTITSGTAAGATVTMYSQRRARYVAGAQMRYLGQVQLGDTGTLHNKRRWGVGYGATMPTITDGAWFQVNNTTFGIRVAKSGTETVAYAIDNGSFNGELGSTIALTNTLNTYEIYYTSKNIMFVMNEGVLHTIAATADTWSDTKSFHAFNDSLNDGTGVNPSVTMKIRSSSIYRLGKLETSPIYKFITGVSSSQILKYGGGMLHNVLIGTATNNGTIAIYDNITGTTNQIALITLPNSVGPIQVSFDVPFSNGLNVVPSANGLAITVTYE